LTRGLDRIQANEDHMRQVLEEHWDVVSEGAQTILRAAGVPDAYEQLKERTRGKRMTRADYIAWVESLDVEENVRGRLNRLSPVNFVGLAEQVVDDILD
jgi:adenylosuccinate lyase